MKDIKSYTIAIDGPSASGKTSAADLVAKKLGFERINSGLIYRAITYILYKTYEDATLDKLKSEEMKDFVGKLSIEQQNGKIYYKNSDITLQLTTSFIDVHVGAIAAEEYIRNKAREIQYSLIDKNITGIVVDGRDIGTCIMPYAFLKIFITAKDSVRAMRRSKQTGKDFKDILEEIVERDKADINRKHSPLKIAKDAILIENDNIDLPTTVDLILKRFNEKLEQIK
ncbi:hypothetical protein GINT2_001658 [Glugoides intestinalis]